MIRNIRNLITTPKILKNSIKNVKSIERNFEVIPKGIDRFEYHNYNVIKEPNINIFYKRIVIEEIKKFNNEADIELIDSYVKWSKSDDSDFQVYPIDNWNNNSITCVISDNKIKYQFFAHEIQDDVLPVRFKLPAHPECWISELTEKDLLIFNSNTAIKFQNHGVSNLLIFTIYSPRPIICSDMLNVYGDEKELEYEKQSVAVG